MDLWVDREVYSLTILMFSPEDSVHLLVGTSSIKVTQQAKSHSSFLKTQFHIFSLG